MKIVVRTISPIGIELNQTIEPIAVGLSQDSMSGLEPLQVSGTMNRIGNTVVAHTRVKTRYVMECSRCLEPVEINREDEFDFDYKVDKDVQVIDLGEDIRQEVILRYPARVLCQENCKGLCPRCGVNLNQEQCKCKK